MGAEASHLERIESLRGISGLEELAGLLDESSHRLLERGVLLRGISGLEELGGLKRVSRGSEPVDTSAFARHSWDKHDKTENISIEEEGNVARHNHDNTLTGSLRGRKKYVRGVHFFEIKWNPNQCGQVSVGIATDEAGLTPKDGMIAGKDDKSIGWNLSTRQVYFNGCAIRTLPESSAYEGPVPDTFVMCLNMNEGILSFSARDQEFGEAMSGLKHIGTELCVMAEIKSPGDSVRMKYLGNADDLKKNMDTKELRFHRDCGKNIELEHDGKTARRKNADESWCYATALTNRPIGNDEVITFRLDKRDLSKWPGCWMVGFTTTPPLELNFLADMSMCKQGNNWVYNENRISFQQRIVEKVDSNLDHLQEGDAVSILRSNNEFRFIVNDSIQSSIRVETEEDIYGFVDVFGQTVQVSIVDHNGSKVLTPLRKTASIPKNEEEFLTKLELTVKLLEQKSAMFIRETALAVEFFMDRAYQEFKDRKLRTTVSEKLANCNGAVVIYAYIEYLEKRGIQAESIESKLLLKLLNVCFNYSCDSLNFAKRLGECGMIEKLIMILVELTNIYQTSNLSKAKVTLAFGCLHNCSRASENKPIFRRLNFTTIVQPYLDCNWNHYDIVMPAVLTMSYVCEENQPDVVQLDSGAAKHIVKILRSAVESSEAGQLHHYKGWYASKIAVGITNLTINATNTAIFDALGSIEYLSHMVLFEDPNEIECALNAIWSLVTEQTVLGTDAEVDLLGRLEKLKQHPNENIRAGAVRLETKMAVLELIGDRKNPTPTGRCEYAEKCKRFMQYMEISEEYRNEEFDSCYCAKCHGRRGSRAYREKGEPPKTYGVPVGWFRFGLSVPAKAAANNAFEEWHRAYHGTTKEAIQKVLDIGSLVPAGTKIMGNERVEVLPGHFTEKRKPANFNIHQVFLSPSMRYAGKDVYSRPSRFKDRVTGTAYTANVAFQVLIAPNSYKVAPQTVGAWRPLDPGFDNDELEWSTNIHGSTILYGLLVKLTKAKWAFSL